MPGLRDRDLRSRGRARRGRRHALLDRLSARGRRACHGRDGAARDAAGRHRRRRESGRPALRRPRRQARDRAAERARGAGRRRRARRSRRRHRRAQGDPRPRPERPRDRPPPRARGDRRDRVRRAHDGRRRRALRGAARRRGGGARARGPARARAAARRAAVAPQRRPLLALGQSRRAARLAAVVLRHAGAGRAGHRRGARRHGALHPEEPRAHLLRLDGADPALVRVAPAVVGPPAPGLVLRLRRDDRAGRAPGALSRLRIGRARARSRRARHVVLVRAVAVRDARLARRDAAPAGVLPGARALHRARHHQPLGRADDHARHRVHGGGAVPRRRHPPDRAGGGRPPHVEVARHRRRSARPDRAARRRRDALRPAQDELDAGRALRRGRHRGGPRASATSSGTRRG